jgi:hypothetical protein
MLEMENPSGFRQVLSSLGTRQLNGKTKVSIYPLLVACYGLKFTEEATSVPKILSSG